MLLFRSVAGLFLVALSTMFWSQGFAEEVAPKSDLSGRFGVLDFFYWNHEWNDYQYPDEASIDRALDRVVEAGFGSVRMDIPWREVERVRGQWDFTPFDQIVDKVAGRGLAIVAMLQYSPDWTGRAWNDPPDLAGFKVYVEQITRRYAPKIHYWEIWNEPDSPIYWTVQDRMKAYTELLVAVYPIIKNADPESKVLIGGLTQHPAASLKMIYRNGGGRSFDIANVHPFQDPLSPGAAERVAGTLRGIRKLMVSNGDADKPIWITEIGCPGLAEGEASRGWWFGKGASEKEQADWVEAITEDSIAWDAQKIFWAFLRDTNHFENDVDRFGLLRRNGTPKPAYDAFKTYLVGPAKESR